MLYVKKYRYTYFIMVMEMINWRNTTVCRCGIDRRGWRWQRWAHETAEF